MSPLPRPHTPLLTLRQHPLPVKLPPVNGPDDGRVQPQLSAQVSVGEADSPGSHLVLVAGLLLIHLEHVESHGVAGVLGLLRTLHHHKAPGLVPGQTGVCCQQARQEQNSREVGKTHSSLNNLLHLSQANVH